MAISALNNFKWKPSQELIHQHVICYISTILFNQEMIKGIDFYIGSWHAITITQLCFLPQDAFKQLCWLKLVLIELDPTITNMGQAKT